MAVRLALMSGFTSQDSTPGLTLTGGAIRVGSAFDAIEVEVVRRRVVTELVLHEHAFDVECVSEVLLVEVAVIVPFEGER